MTGWRALNQGLQAQWQHSALIRRWQLLPSRDRLALLLLGGFLLLVLFYLLLWLPAQRSAQSAKAAFEAQRELYAYMQNRAPVLRGRELQPLSSLDPARLQGLITASAAEQGLIIERLEGEGVGAVQVSLQPVAFEQLLSWLQMLEGQGVRVEEAGLDRRDEGRVAARLSLRVGS